MRRGSVDECEAVVAQHPQQFEEKGHLEVRTKVEKAAVIPSDRIGAKGFVSGGARLSWCPTSYNIPPTLPLFLLFRDPGFLPPPPTENIFDWSVCRQKLVLRFR